MKLSYIIVSLSMTVFIYCMLDSQWGSTGVIAQEELSSYKKSLEDNVSRLSELNQTLSRELDRLANDPARLQEEAYKLGMLRTEDIRIRLPDTPLIDEMMTPGTVVAKPSDKNNNRAIVTGISLSAGLVILFVLSFLQYEWGLVRQNPRTRRSQGVRVQTASLE